MIYHGDCLQTLATLEPESIDCLVTDPPYGLSFMGKDWDKAVPSVDIWKECLRVLKPGAFAFIMSIPRQDCLARMIVNLQDAGFETGFTSLFWAQAQGFPKAQNIGKAVDKRGGKYGENLMAFVGYVKACRDIKKISNKQIDKHLGLDSDGATASHYTCTGGQQPRFPRLSFYSQLKELLGMDNRFDEIVKEAEREVVGEMVAPDGKPYSERQPYQWTPQFSDNAVPNAPPPMITAPATPQAIALDGSYAGFQPKPAVEVILVCMKPLNEKSYVDQALANGKGITWLDSCRIPYESEEDKQKYTEKQNSFKNSRSTEGYGNFQASNPSTRIQTTGRFPANLLCSDDVLNTGQEYKARGNKQAKVHQRKDASNHIYGDYGNTYQEEGGHGDSGSFSRYFDLDKWVDTLPFLITPKASKSEKNKGLGVAVPRTKSGSTPRQNGAENKSPNNHPTVKPLKLMAYLITLGSRPGDTVLDPFMGTGTTGVACQKLGREFIGMEIAKEHCEIASKRMAQSVLWREHGTNDN